MYVHVYICTHTYTYIYIGIHVYNIIKKKFFFLTSRPFVIYSFTLPYLALFCHVLPSMGSARNQRRKFSFKSKTKLKDFDFLRIFMAQINKIVIGKKEKGKEKRKRTKQNKTTTTTTIIWK